MRSVKLVGIIAGMLSATFVSATIIRVPGDFGTIQSALDATLENDTVLVAPGLYVESLTAPSHSFELWGEQRPDSDGAELTILDATSLPGSDSLSTLITQPETHVTVRNLFIHNGIEMREGRIGGPNISGGIKNFATILNVNDCIFDSVASAVYYGHELHITNSDFIGCRYSCVYPTPPTGRLYADNSTFSGSGSKLVSAYSHSEIRNCQFLDNDIGDRLSLTGDSILVEFCTFGPMSGLLRALVINAYGNCVIQNCTFQNCSDVTHLIFVETDCSSAPNEEPLIIITGNLFRDYHPEQFPEAGITAIYMQCQEGSAGSLGIIENNIFDNGDAGPMTPGIFTSGGSAVIRNNLFHNLTPIGVPDIHCIDNQNNPLVLRDNYFDPEGLAANTEQGGAMNAILNWWGHATGPYHPTLNPDGQGATVGDNIDFIPWIEDTTEPNDTAELPDLIPKSFSLSAYPNPFNGTVTFIYNIPIASDARLAVFNLLGQGVYEQRLGMLSTGVHKHSLDLSAYPSGLYLAELSADRDISRIKILLLK